MKKMIRRIIPEEDVPAYFNKLHNISGIFDILLLKRIFSETFFFLPSLMQITLLPAPVTTLLTIIFLESILSAFQYQSHLLKILMLELMLRDLIYQEEQLVRQPLEAFHLKQ
jgi:hypothetical protein